MKSSLLVGLAVLLSTPALGAEHKKLTKTHKSKTHKTETHKTTVSSEYDTTSTSEFFSAYSHTSSDSFSAVIATSTDVTSSITTSPHAQITTVPAYGACGGWNYPGNFVCTDGFTCTHQNEWYYQCVRDTAAPMTTKVTSCATTTTVAAYGACGGWNHPGCYSCIDGWACTSQNDWYHQCVKATTTQTRKPGPKPTCTSFTTIAGFGQCGGIDHDGCYNCAAGFTCSAQNEWYHQCIPGTAPPTQSVSSTPDITKTIVSASASGNGTWFHREGPKPGHKD